MAINITDGMSAVQFKNEIESKAIDKTGDDLQSYLSVNEKSIPAYGANDIIPHSFVYNSVNSLALFFAYYGFMSESNLTAMLDIAFGKNCGDRIYSIGAQLWAFCSTIADEPVETPSGSGSHIKNCKTMDEIKNSALAMSQAYNYKSIRTLIAASPYAKGKLGVDWTVA